MKWIPSVGCRADPRVGCASALLVISIVTSIVATSGPTQQERREITMIVSLSYDADYGSAT
jgi:hypothetical protein